MIFIVSKLNLVYMGIVTSLSDLIYFRTNFLKLQAEDNKKMVRKCEQVRIHICV